MPETNQYILLPRVGLKAASGPAMHLLTSLPVVRSIDPAAATSVPFAGGTPMSVMDTIAENGPKLVSMSDQAARTLNESDAPVRVAPIVWYNQPNPIETASKPLSTGLSPLTSVQITVEDRITAASISGAKVVAFTNFLMKQGDQGVTGSGGTVSLSLTGNLIERIYVYSPTGHWGAYQANVNINPSITIQVEPVNLAFQDCVRKYYGNTRFNLATGVKVGVIDTGVSSHPHLNLAGARNTVTGESAADTSDWQGHGTHVAGLIGANGAPPNGLKGVAPGVPIQGYRVFGIGQGASNYAILKAMIYAEMDSCDIINLSLGGGPYDQIVEEAIADARTKGMLVLIAAGNDGRQSVSFPAAHIGATAVSALGVTGTFPTGSLDDGNILFPPTSSTYPLEFIASFSNIGPEISVAGLGVGTLSTLPGNAYGPMSGTSMASPVVAGCIASLLSQNPVIFGMTRDATRSKAIEKLLLTNCTKRGFGSNYEGYGLPDPAVV